MEAGLPPIQMERKIMSVADFIRSEVNSNEIVLFMKGTQAAPACGFSAQVVRILDHLGVAFKSHDIYESEELRQGIKDYSNWPTIPQLYVRGEFVGGCDIVTEMFRSGELQQLLLKQPEAMQS
jgi:monothiol glutaredoxin